jgi:hypothetical protein
MNREMIGMKQRILVQPQPTIAEARDLRQVGHEKEPEPEWASKIMKYLKNGELPNDKARSYKVRLQSTWYTMIDGVLYRRGYTHPLLRCLSVLEVHYVLRAILIRLRVLNLVLSPWPFSKWGVTVGKCASPGS